MKLSKNFSLQELSSTSLRQYNNIPGEQEIYYLTKLANDILEPFRALVGPLYISSGYRSPKVNKAIGGALTSQHMKGQAADVIPLKKSMTVVKAFELLKNSDIPWDQIIMEYPTKSNGGWCHVSVAPDERKPRKQALLIDKVLTKGKYVVYKPSLLGDLNNDQD